MGLCSNAGTSGGFRGWLHRSRPAVLAWLIGFFSFSGQAGAQQPAPVPAGEKPVVLEFSTRNSGVAELDRMILFVRMPKDLPEGEAPAGVLALAVYSDEAKAVKALLSRPSSANKLYQFADRHRLIVVSWPTATIYNNSQSFTENSKTIDRGDDAFGLSMKSWDREMEMVCSRLKIPYRDVLIYGLSRGAQWAHRFALRMPEKFLAVHAHVNSSYEEPQKEAKSCLWLITTGNQEHGYPASKIFYAKCKELGFPIVYKSQANLGHSGSPQIDELGLRFFEYAWQLKLERDGIKAREDADPMSPKTIPRVGFPASMLKPFFEAPYVGDLLNQDVYPAAKAGEIRAVLKVPIPTREMAEAWGFFNE